ncbi:MAG: Smr/MutS family protein [Hyphomicrobium sp.]
MKKPHGKDRKRHLDEDEAAVWDHAASSIEPLKRAKSRVHATADPDEAAMLPRAKMSRTSESHHASAHAHHKPAAKPSSPPAARKAAPPLADVDRKKVKRLRTGRIEIDGRIDLHGLRQDEAHGNLRAFLFRAQARGWRWVLIITGKGKPESGTQHEPFTTDSQRSRGVLKRNVPRWLEEPDLRGIIISFTAASIAHGGEGALYVHLRKKG